MKLLRSPKRFQKLCKSQILENLSLLNLKELPSSLACLNALKRLEIHSCSALESLPEEGVKGLTSLTLLSVYDCEMVKCLPEGLQHLTTLTSLTISKHGTT
ncbi:hypothetical protein H5410_042968 [Solanum commersonii]|uniref:Uncharacterized protein n=1 Tax=Solanum commersonii TaxID=4109 RepID=A0A9J5Y039_SOLCO|nr:hypothetical protein H5410_042968 [Solanum commersonii]